MPPIEFRVQMFRDERDQARSQYVLLFLMEALVRVNQSLIRDGEAREKRGLGKKWPLLYRSGAHYEREPPGQEHWPDLQSLLEMVDGPGQYPGPWGDCEDLACWRTAELREAAQHKGKDGAWVKGGVKAKPFAKWRRGPEGQFNYHALVLRPDGKIEDPSLVLGMRHEAEFAAAGTAEKLKAGTVQPVIQFAEPPDVMVVDPDSPTGFKMGRPADLPDVGPIAGDAVPFDIATASVDLLGVPQVELSEAQAKLLEGSIGSFGTIDWADLADSFLMPEGKSK
jgi:hypothetical protein